jgi:hypothetical protein
VRVTPLGHVSKRRKCWRFWSAVDAGEHYAAYQFADMARLDAALKSDGYKTLVAQFDHRNLQLINQSDFRLNCRQGHGPFSD